MSESMALRFVGVSKRYDGSASGSIVALQPTTFSIPGGRIVSIVGRSGSGKSTLLHLAAGIDSPTEGEVEIAGRGLSSLSERERTLLRRDTVGLVFQFFHLLPHLSVRDNVALPELIAGTRPSDFEPRIHELLQRVGLANRVEDPVDRLSGGEMQRVAICRALLRRPLILLADEPTGNLDDETSSAVMDLMFELVDEQRLTFVYVTHSPEVAGRAHERWEMHSGTVVLP